MGKIVSCPRHSLILVPFCLQVTANVRQEQIDIALSAGVDSVLSKPFTVQDVLARIKEHMV